MVIYGDIVVNFQGNLSAKSSICRAAYKNPNSNPQKISQGTASPTIPLSVMTSLWLRINHHYSPLHLLQPPSHRLSLPQRLHNWRPLPLQMLSTISTSTFLVIPSVYPISRPLSIISVTPLVTTVSPCTTHSTKDPLGWLLTMGIHISNSLTGSDLALLNAYFPYQHYKVASDRYLEELGSPLAWHLTVTCYQNPRPCTGYTSRSRA